MAHVPRPRWERERLGGPEEASRPHRQGLGSTRNAGWIPGSVEEDSNANQTNLYVDHRGHASCVPAPRPRVASGASGVGPANERVYPLEEIDHQCAHHGRETRAIVRRTQRWHTTGETGACLRTTMRDDPRGDKEAPMYYLAIILFLLL